MRQRSRYPRCGPWTLVAGLVLTLGAVSGCSKRAADETPERGNAACSDGLDNDGDGSTDCSDADCSSESVCTDRRDQSVPGGDLGFGDGPPLDSAPFPDAQIVPGETLHYFPVGDEVSAVDLLFVIDNSMSMVEEQTKLANNFHKFLEPLRSKALGGDLPDLRVGVISTDLGTGDYTDVPSCGDLGGDAAKLLSKGSSTSCPTPTDPWISYNAGQTNVPSGDPDPVKRLLEAFSCIVQLGGGGCGFEQHLEAARRALDPALKINPGFLRQDAALAVVFITDEDDCSASNTQLFDPAPSDDLGPLTSFRCFEFGMTCDINDRSYGPRSNCTPRDDGAWLHPINSRYVDFFTMLKPRGRVVAAAIAGPSTPVEVIPVGSNPEIKESCAGSDGAAMPAIRVKAFVDAFGPQGHFSSICQDDFIPALEQIADRINVARGIGCLQPIADVSPAIGLQADCTVEEVSAGKTTTIPPCAGATCSPCPCWRVVARSECATAYALEVQRSQTPAPGTLVRASCKAAER